MPIPLVESWYTGMETSRACGCKVKLTEADIPGAHLDSPLQSHTNETSIHAPSSTTCTSPESTHKLMGFYMILSIINFSFSLGSVGLLCIGGCFATIFKSQPVYMTKSQLIPRLVLIFASPLIQWQYKGTLFWIWIEEKSKTGAKFIDIDGSQLEWKYHCQILLFPPFLFHNSP